MPKLSCFRALKFAVRCMTSKSWDSERHSPAALPPRSGSEDGSGSGEAALVISASPLAFAHGWRGIVALSMLAP